MGAKAAPIVRVLLVLFFPVAYPISKVRPPPDARMSLLFAAIWEELTIILVYWPIACWHENLTSGRPKSGYMCN